MAKHAPPVNTTPTIRIVNGIPVRFYSPVQLESIVPAEVRLPKSRCSAMQPDYSGHIKKHQQAED